uniref:glutamine--fructose-6-phosphate transaminase (isomerizing) n=1 Tax=Ictidomys tridecemlineatus TaxID=43179 RepID=A0A287CTH7_ICTTR
MCIFAYLNYHVPRTRREILETLIKGLQRLEYRGYDSAGISFLKNKGFVWELMEAMTKIGKPMPAKFNSLRRKEKLRHWMKKFTNNKIWIWI